MTLRIAPLTLLAAFLLCFAAPAAFADGPQISTGAGHTCAVSDTGVVSCWGKNDLGQLGDGSTTERTTPVLVVGLPTIRSVAVGESSTCALAVDGSVWCWGGNQKGQLGNIGVDAAAHPFPTKVPFLSTAVTQLTAGTSNFCLLYINNEAWCWGGNDYGEIGNAGAANPQPFFQKVDPIGPVKKIWAGYTHACAAQLDGQVLCWGYNASGALGYGIGPSTTVPVPSTGATSAADVYAGGYTSCSLTVASSVMCWGGGGMVGNGPGSSPTPVEVSGLIGVTALGGSNSNNCALKSDQTVRCWGGALPNGSPTSIDTPTEMPALAGSLAISANGFASHNCVVVRGGGVRCWGFNSFGQLGNGTTSATSSYTPSVVGGVDLVQKQYAATGSALGVLGTPRADRKRKNYTLFAGMNVSLPPLVSSTDACAGTLTISVKYSYKKYRRVKGKRKRVTVKKTAKGSAALAPFSEVLCISKASLKLPLSILNGKKVSVNGSFSGNASLAAVSAVTKPYKLKYYAPKKKKKSGKKK